MRYYVYTDGSCFNNGSENSVAGIGIYFGENDKRNTSKLLKGKNTNNTAEIKAMIYAHKLIKDDLKKGVKVTIVSDSKYAIRCATTYGEKLEKDNWEKDVPNLELVKKLYYLYKDSGVKFKHIFAHTNKQDKHSIGNVNADKLATQHSLKKFNENNKIDKNGEINKKIYLDIPYNKKDIGKELGTKWDPSIKKWYIYENNSNKDKILELFPLKQ